MKNNFNTLVRAFASCCKFTLPLLLTAMFAVKSNAQTIACTGDINVSLDPTTCDLPIAPATFVAIAGGGIDNIMILDGSKVIYNLATDVTGLPATWDDVPANKLKKELIYKVISGSNSCWGHVIIEDKAIIVPTPDVIDIDCHFEEAYLRVSKTPVVTYDKAAGIDLSYYNRTNAVTGRSIDYLFPGEPALIADFRTNDEDGNTTVSTDNILNDLTLVVASVTADPTRDADNTSLFANGVNIILEDCSGIARISYYDVPKGDICADGLAGPGNRVIERHWVIEDGCGNKAERIINFNVTQIDIVAADPAASLTCEDALATTVVKYTNVGDDANFANDLVDNVCGIEVTETTLAPDFVYPSAVAGGYVIGNRSEYIAAWVNANKGKEFCGYFYDYADTRMNFNCGRGMIMRAIKFVDCGVLTDPLTTVYSIDVVPVNIGVKTENQTAFVNVTNTVGSHVQCGYTGKLKNPVLDLKCNMTASFGLELFPVTDAAIACDYLSVVVDDAGTPSNDINTDGDESDDDTATLENTDAAFVANVDFTSPINAQMDASGSLYVNSLPCGIYLGKYTITDCKGDVYVRYVKVCIQDNTPPTPVCQQETKVAITTGITKVFTASFDSGSYDNCCLDKLQVKRMDDRFRASYGDFVEFDCADLGKSVTVQLKATDCYGLENICMVNVTFDNKVVPVLACPADVKVQCTESTDPSNTGRATVTGNCTTFNVTYTDSKTEDNGCGTAMITRTWSVVEQPSIKCTQIVTILNYNHMKACDITFPADKTVEQCNGAAPASDITASYNGCDFWAKNQNDVVLTADGTDGSCKKILRDHTVLDWCYLLPRTTPTRDNWNHYVDFGVFTDIFYTNGAFDGDKAIAFARSLCLVRKDNGGTITTSAQAIAAINEAGLRIVASAATNGIVSTSDAHTQAAPAAGLTAADLPLVAAADYATDANANGLKLAGTMIDGHLVKLKRRFDDYITEQERYDNAAEGAVNATDERALTSNQKALNGFWSRTQIIKIIDQVAPVLAPRISAKNLDQAIVNGSTIVYAAAYDCGKSGVVTVNWNGTDACTNDAVQISYTLTLENGTKSSGLGKTATFTDLPYGTHKVVASATDGCGNAVGFQFSITVKDGKKPTPIAKTLLSTTLTPNSVATSTVRATDFNNGSYDNCPGELRYRIQKGADCATTYAPLTSTAEVLALPEAITFTCQDYQTAQLTGAMPVRFYVIDVNGNFDYVDLGLFIDANMVADKCASATACPTSGTQQLVGSFATEAGDKVEGVAVKANGTAFGTTSATGTADKRFSFGSTVTVAGEKTIDPLNGVSTMDLVLISKHILGVENLNSAYKMVAADVNKSGSITTLDMVELRKMILRINDNFSNNTSWRFVDANQALNTTNVFTTTLNESVNVTMNANKVVNFTSVKTGDVNGSAVANSLLGTESRSAVGTLEFNTMDQAVKAGQEVKVTLNAATANVEGFQFTLNHNNLTLTNVEGIDANNFGIINANTTTASWNGKADATEIVLTFKAKADGQLKDMVSLNSSVTSAEAYTNGLESMNVALKFNGQATASNKFELYQNQPNPFKGETRIGFNLPEASAATLTIFDAAGRTLKVVEGNFAKGFNTVNVSDLSATGVLYYTLRTANESATMKMIITE